MNLSYSVLVLGCNKHVEAAKINFWFLKKNVPYLLEHTYYVTDQYLKTDDDFFANVIELKTDNYSERLLYALESVDSKNILIILDDDFVTKEFDCENFKELILIIDEEKIDYCKLVGAPTSRDKVKPKIKVNGKSLYKINPLKHYGMSLQPSIWNKDLIVELARSGCRNGPTAWDLEISCRELQRKDELVMRTFNSNLLSIKNAIIQGKLFPYTNKILKRNGFQPLEGKKMPLHSYVWYKLKAKVLSHLPFRSLLKKIGKKFGHKYYTDE